MWYLQAVECAGAHGLYQRGCFQQVVPRCHKEAALRRCTAPVTRAANTLHRRRDGTRRVDLADQIDRADINAKFQRGGCHQQPYLACLQLALGFQAELARERAMVRRHILLADALANLVRQAFNHGARIDKHQCRTVLIRQLCQPRVNRLPDTTRRYRAKLLVWYLNAEIEPSMAADSDDLYLLALAGAGKKLGNQRDRILRRRQTNTLRRPAMATHHCPGRQAVAATHQRVQSFERQHQVRAAFVIGDRVDLVDNHRANLAQVVTAFLRGEQDVQRFRRRHQDVWRTAQHLLPLLRQRIASTHARAYLRAKIATLHRQRLYLA